MIVAGGLIGAVQHLPGVGVLVIDEYVEPPSYVRAAQSKVLTSLAHLPTWAFTNHGRPLRVGLPIPSGTPVIDKPKANAFAQTGLFQQARAAGVGHFVVMGYHRDACVAATIGHLWKPAPQYDDFGAINFGFTVHTHLYLVHGGPKSKKRDRPLWYATARMPEIPDGKRLLVYQTV